MNRNRRIAKITIGLIVFYILNKLYKKWKYAQKLFKEKKDIENKAILITGCDTGFGNGMALKLSIKLGHRVIATCLKQESVDIFLSNSSFTRNKSTAIVLDVTNKENIQSVKQYTIKYLKETNSILWGIVNNAGIAIPGQFEIVPAEMDLFERNVLFNGPLNIIRSFLPLLPGRKNYKTFNKSISIKTANNGGRIVNIASAAARLIYPTDIRYGSSKASLSYFSHVLRMEISPRFGIWVTTIEPNAYNTPIFKNSIGWIKKVKKSLEENKETELMEMYQFDGDINSLETRIQQYTESSLVIQNVDDVIDAVIHGLTAKYPQRNYEPGWDSLVKFLVYGPLWITEPFQMKLAEMLRVKYNKDQSFA